MCAPIDRFLSVLDVPEMEANDFDIHGELRVYRKCCRFMFDKREMNLFLYTAAIVVNYVEKQQTVLWLPDNNCVSLS